MLRSKRRAHLPGVPPPAPRPLTAAVALALAGALLAALGDLGPYARNGGPVLVQVTSAHGLHVADLVVVAVALLVSPRLAAALCRRWARRRSPHAA